MQTLTLVPIPAHGNLIQIPTLAQDNLRGNKVEDSRVANRQVGAQASPSVFRLRVALRLHRRSAKNSCQILNEHPFRIKFLQTVTLLFLISTYIKYLRENSLVFLV